MSKLYIVATPIGNLEDITLRAITTLREADVIACEDTRHTQMLLTHLGITGKRLIACHAHNEAASSQGIVGLLGQGLSVAYCSDAGTPGVSDPGSRLVRAVREAGFDIVPIPGASASVTLISGLGGRAGIRSHAIKSAHLISAMNPEYASILTLHLTPESPMAQEIARGEMELITPDEIMDETELFLENVDSPGTVFRTNHASNYVALGGTFNEDIPRLLEQIRFAREKQRYRMESWRRRL